MFRVQKWLTITAALVIAFANFLVPAQEAFACSCIAPPPPADALNDSAAVFAGTVREVDAPEGAEMSSADPVGIAFAVSDVWKGEISENQVITTPRNSASCGYAFEVGMEYLVYAYEGETGLQTNLCSRTALVSPALEDLNALGESSAPLPGGTVSSPPVSGFSTMYLWLGIAGVVVLGLVAAALVLNRRNTAENM